MPLMVWNISRKRRTMYIGIGIIGLLAVIWIAKPFSTSSYLDDFVDSKPLFEILEQNFEVHYEPLIWMVSDSPHPFGSVAQKQLGEKIQQRFLQKGIRSWVQGFVVDTPNPIFLKNPTAPAEYTLKREGYNIFAAVDITPTPSCWVILGSHYDTKIIEEGSYHGANDSGSSTIGLIAIIEALAEAQKKSLLKEWKCSLLAAWFDGEESVLPNWTDGEFLHPARIKDNTYGSRFFVSQLKSCKTSTASSNQCLNLGKDGEGEIVAFILSDMIGSPNQILSRDSNSDERLIELAQHLASRQDLNVHFSNHQSPIEDDHIPFVKNKIPSINLIDFNNVQHWHRSADTIKNLDSKSILEAIKLKASIANFLAINPQYLK